MRLCHTGGDGWELFCISAASKQRKVGVAHRSVSPVRNISICLVNSRAGATPPACDM